MKTFEIKAGERERVIRKFSNSLALTYSFDVEPLDLSDVVSGVVEVVGSNWLAPKPAITKELNTSNFVEKGIWDTMYSVYVIPDVDVRVSMAKANFNKMWPLLLFGIAVTGIALAILVAMGFYG